MAAGDLVQTGTAVAVGFNSVTNSNLIMQAATETLGAANVKEIMGVQNAVVTKLITNPHLRMRLTGVVTAAGTELATLRALKVGDTLSVNSVSCMIAEPIEIEDGPEETRATIVVIKEASMTYA